jgi:hypothetical protein
MLKFFSGIDIMSEDYVEEDLEDSRCLECGNEEGNKFIRRNSKKVQPVPIDSQGKCGDCGYQDNPNAFRWEYKKERMTEEEIEDSRRKRDEYEDRMAESEYDADRLAEEREDSNGGYSV